MLGDSDEIDLTDPLRGFDPATDTGDWIDLTPVGSVPTACPAFPVYPAFDFTPGYVPAEELAVGRSWLPDLSPDAGRWAPTPDVYRFLLLLFAAAAVVAGAYLFGKT